MARSRTSRSNSSNPPVMARHSLTNITSKKLPYLHPSIDIAHLDVDSAEDISRAHMLPEYIKKIIAHEGVNYHVYKNGKLGSGAFGDVVLAQNATSGEWIALKRLKKRNDSLLKNEIANLKNSNELIFHLQHTEEGDYLGMKLHSGVDLFHVMKDIRRKRLQAFSYTQKLLIAKRILKAVADLHNAKAAIVNPELRDIIHKIIHRDLKPENILLDNELQIRLVDLGLAAVTRDKVKGLHDTFLVGTRDYIAPETKEGAIAIYNEKTEMHALGMILAQLFYNCEKEQTVETANRSDGLLVLIESMLDNDPDFRPELNEAYSQINLINNEHARIRTAEHRGDFLVYTVSIRDILKLAHANILDQFTHELIIQGAKSVAFIGDVGKVESAELVKFQRALRKAGIIHIAPLVYSTKAGSVEAEKAARNYYNRIFGTESTTMLSSRDIAKNVFKRETASNVNSIYTIDRKPYASRPPNKALPSLPSNPQKNNR